MHETAVKLVKEFGFPVALNVFLLWAGWQMFSELQARVVSYEAYIRDTLTMALRDNTAALEGVRAALGQERRQPTRPDGPDGLHSLVVPNQAKE